MKFKKITAEFSTGNIPMAEELICHIFFSFNLKGVVCDVPIPEPDEGFGTDTLPKVDKIVGPGNQWVQMAKRKVFGRVDIDAIAEGLQRLSQLVTEFPQIQDMEINPYVVGVEGTTAMAVDGFMQLRDESFAKHSE